MSSPIWLGPRSWLCKKTSILPLGADVGSAMSNNHSTHHKEHRAAPETPPTNPSSLFLPLGPGLQLPLLLQLGVGKMLIPSAPKSLNSWQARKMSEKAILYPHSPYSHSSKEESDKLGPGSLSRVPRRGLLPQSSPKIFVIFGREIDGGIFPVQAVQEVWCFPVRHFNTSMVTLRCDQDRK